MKLKKLEQELDFVKFAEIVDIKKYIFQYKFRFQTEVEMVKRKCPSLILMYLSIHGISQKAATEIIYQGSSVLIEELLKTKQLMFNPEKLFFDIGDYYQILFWLKRHDSQEYPEKELFWNGSDEEIVSFIEKNTVSLFGQLDLIRKKKDKAVEALILKNRLNEKNKIAVMQYGPKVCAILLLKTISNSKLYCLFRQMYIVRFGSKKEIADLIKQRLKPKAEELFFEVASFNFVESYSKHFCLPKAQIYLLKRGYGKNILNYLSKTELSEDAQELLLKRGVHAEIKAYIKRHIFSIENEVRFIKRGKHREIILYLANHSLSDEAQLELIKRGNNLEISKLVELYPLANIAEDELQKLNFKIKNFDEVDLFAFD